VIDFLHVLTGRSVQRLDVSAAGLLLADPHGELRVAAASSEAARLLELLRALPMRLVIGALNLFRADPGPFDPAGIGQALADVATISLLRDFAKSRDLRLSDLARAFVDGTETLTGLTASRPQQRLRPDRRPASGANLSAPRSLGRSPTADHVIGGTGTRP
jgi:hypothetical protein